MRNNSHRLDHAFGQMPQAFTARIDQTLRHLEEEKPMKRLTLRMVLLTALLLALLSGIACAVVSQGMEWYYHNRFTAYQEYEPQKHEAILNHRQAVQVQEGMEDPLVSVQVCEASWVQEHEMLVISLAAVPVDGGAYELHPAWNLDADGSYVGAESLAEYADDPEARAEHWLWTEKGFGPVGQTMSDPAKTLLLFEAADACLGAMKENLSMMISDSSMDCYVNENGEVMTLKTEETILAAALNDQDWLAVTTEKHGYKGCVSVYDKELELVFEFKSSH